jgi:predicted transcriptional regulator
MFTRSSLLKAGGSRRDSIVIISELLSCAIEGSKKTEIMYRVGLSTTQLNRYVPLLVKSELLEMFKHKKATIYKTTTKGKSFLEAFGTLTKLID